MHIFLTGATGFSVHTGRYDMAQYDHLSLIPAATTETPAIVETAGWPGNGIIAG